MSLTYLTSEPGSGFRSGGQDYTESQAADLIEGSAFATVNRYGDVVASDDLAKVARHGEPSTGADLAARLRGDRRG